MSFYNSDATDDDLSMDFDTVAIKSEADISVGNMVADGRYHAVVEKVEKDNGNNPCYKIAFKVIDGTVRGQVNKSITERLFLTEKAKPRLMLFASRLGLFGQQDYGKPHVSKNWGSVVGSHVVIEVKTRTYPKTDGTEGKSTNLSFDGIWKLDDPKVADVPKGHVPAAGSAPAAAPTASFDDV